MDRAQEQRDGEAGLIAVDWGTTNRRAYRLGGGDAPENSLCEDKGVLSVEPGRFPDEIATLRRELGQGPMLLAGMIGSNRGWVEAPYVPCPAGLEELARAVIRPMSDVAIIPGLSYVDADRTDVMRGEEVQLLGAVHAGLVPPDARICHPGTHAKWAQMEAGRVTAFRTVMTGELFALLRGGGILAPQLVQDAQPNADFARGVERGWTHGDLSADLFTARADALLGRRGDDASAYVSGLLIGCDLRAGLRFVDEGGPVYVMGDGALTRLYATALSTLRLPAEQIDGERAFLAGIRALSEIIA